MVIYIVVVIIVVIVQRSWELVIVIVDITIVEMRCSRQWGCLVSISVGIVSISTSQVRSRVTRIDVLVIVSRSCVHVTWIVYKWRGRIASIIIII